MMPDWETGGNDARGKKTRPGERRNMYETCRKLRNIMFSNHLQSITVRKGQIPAVKSSLL